MKIFSNLSVHKSRLKIHCNRYFNNEIKPNQQMTNSQMMEKLKKLSLYKRIMPRSGIPFTSKKSQEMLKECIIDGTCDSFFLLVDQYQTQSDPSFCGPTTMVCIFNSLGVDPKKKWKGYIIIYLINSIWRWYLEDVIKCVDIEKVKEYGMTLEEFSIISKCNGVFTESYRPDLNEEETQKDILKYIESRYNHYNNKIKPIIEENSQKDIYKEYEDYNTIYNKSASEIKDITGM